MADITFNYEMQNALINLEQSLLDDVLSTINNTKMGVIYDVSDTIRNNTSRFYEYKAKDMADYQIENKLTTYIDELKSLEHEHVQKTVDSIKKMTESIIRMASTKKIEELESKFRTLSNELIRSQDPKIFKGKSDVLVNSLGPFIASHFLFNPNIEYAISQAKVETSRILNKYSEKLTEEFQNLLRNYLNRYMMQVLENIDELIKEEEITQGEVKEEFIESQEIPNNKEQLVTPDDVLRIVSDANKLGLHIEETFDGYTIKSKQNGISENLYKDESGKLFNQDHSIELEDLGPDGTLITMGDNVIRQTMDTIYLGTRDNPNQVEIISDFLEYKIKYAGEIITDPLKKGIVVCHIEKKFPEIYPSLSNEILFQNLLEEISNANKENEELYEDEFGIVRINDKKRIQFLEKISALGFKGIEKNDGFYVVDRSGVEHAVKYAGKYAYLEDNPKVGFNTNVYQQSNQEITGPIIDYYVGDFNFSCTADYLYMTIKCKNQNYVLGYNSQNKFICEGMCEGQYKDPQATLKIFAKFCPEALEKVKNACMKHEIEEKEKANNADKADKAVSPVAEEKEVPKEKSDPNDETKNLMDELDGRNAVNEETYFDDTEEEKKAEKQEGNNMSIDDEIFELEQDPKVQRYIELMKLQAEYNAMTENPELNLRTS